MALKDLMISTAEHNEILKDHNFKLLTENGQLKKEISELKRFISTALRKKQKERGDEERFTEIPRLVKDVREALGYSQSKFGKEFDIDGSMVSRWETGERLVPRRVIEFCLGTGVLALTD